MKLRPAALLVATLLVSSRAWAAGAVDTVAAQAAQGIGRAPAAPVVVAAPLVSDVAAPRGDALELRIASLVAGKLGAGARTHPHTAPLATARAVAGRAGALVFVQGEIAHGDLRVTLDVYPSMANAWDRIRNPVPAPTAHAFATAEIDAEVRAFLAPLLLEQASVVRAGHDEGDVLAAACGDVDGDGGDELVLVSRARVAMGRLRVVRPPAGAAGANANSLRFVAERAVAWSDLAPRAAAPMREPLASAGVAEGAIDVGTTDRGGMALGPDLAPGAPLAGLPVESSEGLVCLLSDAAAGAFDGAPVDCLVCDRSAARRAVDCAIARDTHARMAVPSPRFDAFASAPLVDAAGGSRAPLAVREPSGKIRLASGAVVYVPDGDFGAQLALADLDQDGVPEVVTTADGGDDAIDVWSWTPGVPELRPRLHLPAPAGVRALATCPAEQGGAPALVAVVGDEVWIVKAAGYPPTPLPDSRASASPRKAGGGSGAR